MKRAFVTPLIKKLFLDCEIFKNYRPVSNFFFVSKLIKRIVCVQLVDHLKENYLYEIFQSAYRQLHSTETALLRVQNDILQAVDSEGGAILVLLDPSAAFDTIDHQKLLDLLDYSFGIRGGALRWFKSYLQDRTQTVQIGSSTSEPVTLKYGVPQGSVLEPILFTMYTTPLGNIIRNHNLDFHLYADDTQLYISFKPCDSIYRQTAISQVEACTKDIKTWMTNNLLKLNDDKTELIIVTTIETTSRQEDIVINIGDSPIAPSMEPPGTLVSCLIQPVVLMIIWTKFAKILTISCIPSVKFESTLTNPRLKNDKFGSDIPFGLLQQPSVWYQWILSVSASTLPE